jgi:SpoVK/Ycf46/Vps4 family AAA+-type ATPase
MKHIFDQAKLHAPTILFIDEIDALCPRRDERVGSAGDRDIIAVFYLHVPRSVFNRLEVMWKDKSSQPC